MNLLRQLKDQLKEKGRLDNLHRADIMAMEQAWLQDNGKQCSKCPRTDLLTVDHIISKDLMCQMGLDPREVWNEENLQVLCKPCNQFKMNRLDFSNPKTKPLLLKYLQNV